MHWALNKEKLDSTHKSHGPVEFFFETGQLLTFSTEFFFQKLITSIKVLESG